MKKLLLTLSLLICVTFSLSAQNKVKYVSSNTSSMNLTSLNDNNVNTVITRQFLAGYNTLCLPFSMSNEQLSSSAKDIRIERLAGVGQEGSTLCLYFIDCTNEGIEAGMPYLVYSPTTQTLRAQSNETTHIDADAITIRMHDNRGNSVTFGSSWNSIAENGRYGIPAQQDVTPLESVLIRTTGDKTFLPTRCGFVWETQSSNAQGIEIRHVKSLSDATGIEMLDMNGSKVDVYDVNGRIVKSKAGSLDGLPHGIYVVGGKKIIK